MRKHLTILFLLMLISARFSFSQQSNVFPDSAKVIYKYKSKRLDSAKLAQQKIATDSILRVTWVLPDSAIDKNAFLDSVQKEYLFPVLDLYAWHQKFKHLKKKTNHFQMGTQLKKGNVWVLGFIVFMLTIFAILKNAFSKQLSAITEAFFSNRILNNINKENNLFNSWPFLLLFIQFGFIFGIFFFLVAQYHNLYQALQGFRFALSVSIIIILLYALKIIILRFLGYVFNMQKPVGEYISILYLSYFNASLLFIPLVVAFALSPLKYGAVYIAISLLILGVIFTFQLLRAGVTILSSNKFSKVHLFVYFCALEICPILILIKTVGL